MSKVDILAFGAHPDDVELGCAATLIKHIKQGKSAAIVDITAGELGTRGNAQLRAEEAAKASEILGVSARENLGFKDGFFRNDSDHQMEVVKMLRKYQPEIVLCNAVSDRHPDHGRAGALVSEGCFLAGLIKVDTGQNAWRPKAVYHYVQDRYMKPDVIVDVSEEFELKMEAIMAYASQFNHTEGPVTPISTPEFLEAVKARHVEYGRLICSKYGEGFTTERTPGVTDLFQLR